MNTGSRYEFKKLFELAELFYQNFLAQESISADSPRGSAIISDSRIYVYKGREPHAIQNGPHFIVIWEMRSVNTDITVVIYKHEQNGDLVRRFGFGSEPHVRYPNDQQEYDKYKEYTIPNVLGKPALRNCLNELAGIMKQLLTPISIPTPSDHIEGSYGRKLSVVRIQSAS